MIRRTGRLFFERDSLEAVYPRVMDELAKELHWDAERKDREWKAFAEEYHLAKTFL